ncbi:MAG: DinB family protein [Vicinamibacterales bacterium]
MCADRAATILARFNAAHNELVWKLRDCAFAAGAEGQRREGWNAAQIGWHVAVTNDFIASVLTGEKALAQPAPAEFKESLDTRALAAQADPSEVPQPPSVVGLDSAIERLRASAHHVSKAIAALSPERGTGYCVAMPFGTLSLYELADFGAAHVIHHSAEVARALAGA